MINNQKNGNSEEIKKVLEEIKNISDTINDSDKKDKNIAPDLLKEIKNLNTKLWTLIKLK